MRSLTRTLAIMGLGAGLAGAALAGCFSERDATAPAEGECRFPIGEDIPGSTVVVIRRFAFGPSEVRIRAGERITWINCDEDPHTSTADEGEWSSPTLAPGTAFTHTFAEAGEFTYHCEPHPFMTGRVIVE
ncbi:MAG: cupredoxin domain-containing protein [Gemmatimonadales bacterium]